MKGRRIWWALTVWLSVLVPCSAQPPGPLVVVLLPGTNLSDWRRADAPTLHRIMAGGALAVMNTRTARLPNDHTRETPESAALTLGAGSRAAGGPEATNFQPAGSYVSPDVTAGDLFARRTGIVPPPDSLVNVRWPRVVRENQDRGYDIHLGNLADGLAAHAIPAYAVGPMADAVACSGQGMVRPAAPAFDPMASAFVVYDAGDEVPTADRTLTDLVGRLKVTHGRLIVLSPSVSDAEYARGERLAPLVMWGEGIAPGLIYSPSTHRAGLVTNTDFAPTVATYFGAALPVEAFGGPWQVRPEANAERMVARLEAQAYQQSRAMRLLPYLAIGLGLLVLFGTLLWFRRQPAPALSVLTAVLVLLLIVCDSPLWLVGGLIIALASRLVLRSSPRSVSLLLSAIVVVLVGDMCLGDPLMRRTMLGYSAVEGARYYGIGNEAMGALIGAALVVAASFWRPGSRGRKGLVVCGLTVIAALLGSPFAGAKAGGLLVAVGSFVTLVWRLRGGAWNARAVGLALGAAALALGAVAVLDLHSGQQTHVGRALGRILGGGPGEAGDIVRRKLAVEGRLLYHSAWAAPLWAAVAGLTALRRRIAEADGQTQALAQSGAVAIVLCLAFNDAGVVAAALCAACLWSGLMAAQTQNGPQREEAKIAPPTAGRD